MKELIKNTKKLKLLYIEDSQEARESTLLILQEFFDNIIVSVDGEDGFNKFKQNSFDLIITDINMPKMNGLEMAKKIREIDKDIPILILSAHNETGMFVDSIKIGIDGYLFKPIVLDQFIFILDKVIDKLRLTKVAKTNLHFLEEYKNVVNEGAIVSKADPYGVITYANDMFCKISGYSLDELLGKNHNIVRHPDNPPRMFRELWHTIKDKKEVWRGVIRNLAKNGKSYYVDATIKPVLDENGDIVEYIAIRHDITEVMNPKRQFDDAVKNAKEPVVVYIKIEDFELLEEFFDNTTIEQIQDEMAIYLENILPKDCKFEKIYQLNHGEYGMVEEKEICLKDKNLFIKNLKKFQNSVKEKIINIKGIDYNVSIIISYSYDKNQALESAKLGIKELLKTKENFISANNLAQIKQDIARKNIQTLFMIKDAMENNKIISYFQPIINNKTQTIEKYESLVRLIDKNKKVLSPFFFLDVAKKGKYYTLITNIVLENSFKALNLVDTEISINISALDIEFKTTREKIFSLLKEYKNDATRVVFELLEDENIKDMKFISNFIKEIKEFGVSIAIDDFGAGYSNFERLLDYHPDILKIDGSITKNITSDDYSLSILKTIVSFAKEQNLKTVAEFVENEEIFKLLDELGVDYSQGYYFGKPEPIRTK